MSLPYRLWKARGLKARCTILRLSGPSLYKGIGRAAASTKSGLGPRQRARRSYRAENALFSNDPAVPGQLTDFRGSARKELSRFSLDKIFGDFV